MKLVIPYNDFETQVVWEHTIGTYIDGQTQITESQLKQLGLDFGVPERDIDIDRISDTLQTITDVSGASFNSLAIVDSKHQQTLRDLAESSRRFSRHLSEAGNDSGWIITSDLYNKALVAASDFTFNIG